MNKQPDMDDFDNAVTFTDAALDVTDANDPVDMVDAAPENPVEPPAASAEAKAKPPALAALRANLPLVIAALAVFASLVSTIGLIVASRNMAAANQRIATLEETVRQAAKARPAVMVAAAHGNPPPATTAASVDVRAALDDFRRDLVRYQNMGSQAGWVDAVRDGQAELANRVNSIAEKLDRIDRRLNNSRPASPAADRARPS